MRKDKEQQKKAQVKQMELFGKTSEPSEANASGTGTLLLNELNCHRDWRTSES